MISTIENKKYRPDKSEKDLVKVGQIATGVLVITGMLWIPFQESLSGGGLFNYLQSVQALISPPIAAVFLLGLFIKRINTQGAMAALYSGAFLGIARLVSEIYEIENILTQPLFLHFALYLFLICSGIMLVVSYMTPAPDYNSIKDIVYDYNSSSNKKDSESKTDKLLTGLLIICVFILWFTFS